MSYTDQPCHSTLDRFEGRVVELLRSGRVKLHVQRHEGICETLRANVDGP